MAREAEGFPGLCRFERSNQPMSDLLPLFVNLEGRRVLLVGGGTVAAAKLRQLLASGADVVVVSPDVRPEIERSGVAVTRRCFTAADLDGVWLVVAAATPSANREVAEAARDRRIFVNAVDDPANASAFLSGVVRRDGVTLAISTSGTAPGLTALLREALDAVLPRDLKVWVQEARRQRKAWRRDGVPMVARRPLLLEALNRIYGIAKPRQKRQAQPASQAPAAAMGRVSLVGAGPGDPDLLTRRAVARLRAADLVLYDALVDERTLAIARRAHRFFVGKRAGHHALSQSEIHAIMIRAARRGRLVVRLKGGDPFVFGRGGEEAVALANAGVPCEVVPGVTSAIAAPALAGIPLTYRGVASAFLVVTGHDEELFARLIGDLQPSGLTLVVLMGLGRRRALASTLIDRGWSPGTPAAIVADASGQNEQVWRGTIETLSADRAVIETDDASVIVVGDVAALACISQAGSSTRDESQHRLGQR
jgi:uroporphyrin-III C-methyltransferase/precorrin-2 dehydrogenase/sirohydrochlorin ferrochelatase